MDYSKEPPDGEWVPYRLPMVEGRCIPESRMRLEGGHWVHEWMYPEPDPDYVDPEIMETENYSIEDKEEFYNYKTVCKKCGVDFIAHSQVGLLVRNYCPGCGAKLE